ncbi:MAG: hypothetical protein JWQ89_1596 [Devosia sp.]|nr:hypothetical protein [Devosia sp.]
MGPNFLCDDFEGEGSGGDSHIDHVRVGAHYAAFDEAHRRQHFTERIRGRE